MRLSPRTNREDREIANPTSSHFHTNQFQISEGSLFFELRKNKRTVVNFDRLPKKDELDTNELSQVRSRVKYNSNSSNL